jgi:hypothetical protein
VSEPPADPLLDVQMPLSEWHVVLRHLKRGILEEVGNTWCTIVSQLEPQMAAAHAAAQAKEIQAARELAEADDAAQRRQAAGPKAIGTEKVVH